MSKEYIIRKHVCGMKIEMLSRAKASSDQS